LRPAKGIGLLDDALRGFVDIGRCGGRRGKNERGND
jgi:hypothetical protein